MLVNLNHWEKLLHITVFPQFGSLHVTQKWNVASEYTTVRLHIYYIKMRQSRFLTVSNLTTLVFIVTLSVTCFTYLIEINLPDQKE